ncbi:MAG: nitrite reductase large subunit, partial [Candidatus Goldiibacteriota bacterium]
GLWPASREQGAAAGENAAGGRVEYKGSVLSTRLKVAGVEVGSLGVTELKDGIEAVSKKDGSSLKKLFIKDKKIAGAILIGDISKYQAIQELIKKGETINDAASLI